LNILITGGASGLGEAVTRRFVEAGHTVYFTFAKSAARASDIASRYPRAEPIECDFSNEASIASLLSAIPGMDLDVLINNALPSMTKKHFHQAAPEGFLSSFALNVLPVVQIAQQAIKCFRKKKSGKIITVLSSYVVNRPPIGLSEYVANKAYLLSLSRSWAVENAKFNITSNCVSPSTMITGLTSDMDERQIEDIVSHSPTGRLVTPDEVAAAILALVEMTSYVNGTNLLINGGADF
jgi:3-oxoacyl-[acyl-carrier protein] reductase